MASFLASLTSVDQSNLPTISVGGKSSARQLTMGHGSFHNRLHTNIWKRRKTRDVMDKCVKAQTGGIKESDNGYVAKRGNCDSRVEMQNEDFEGCTDWRVFVVHQ